MSKETETPYDYHRRKANQHWEMAGLARQDRDRADEERHTTLARFHHKQAAEAKAAEKA